MVSQELTYLVPRRTSLHKAISRYFRYNEYGRHLFYQSETDRRQLKHADKCLAHAHYLIEKWFVKNGINAIRWRISVVRPCSNGDIFRETANFSVKILEKEEKNEQSL